MSRGAVIYVAQYLLETKSVGRTFCVQGKTGKGEGRVWRGKKGIHAKEELCGVRCSSKEWS